jgi:hypothetical protein
VGAVLLGLDGFVLLAVDEHDGELELAVETTMDMVGCPDCAAVPTAHGRRAEAHRVQWRLGSPEIGSSRAGW